MSLTDRQIYDELVVRLKIREDKAFTDETRVTAIAALSQLIQRLALADTPDSLTEIGSAIMIEGERLWLLCQRYYADRIQNEAAKRDEGRMRNAGAEACVCGAIGEHLCYAREGEVMTVPGQTARP